MNSLNKTTQVTSFLHLPLLFFLISITLCPSPSSGCHEEERMALLDIKSNVVDPSGRLSSWQESVTHKNCCDWRGIGCSSESYHIISIDLRNKDLETYIYDRARAAHPEPDTALRGILSPSIFNITHLEYLDLGFNDFQESKSTHQFYYLTKLNHLDLSFTDFSTSISTQFSNLTFLKYLDLSCSLSTGIDIFSRYRDTYTTSCLKSPSTKWVRGLVNLQVLGLGGIDLFQATSSSQENFVEDISYLWNLKDLDISLCNISGPVFSIHQFHNLSRLSTLKVSYNSINSLIPLHLSNLTSLSVLHSSDCDMQGSIPYLPQLKELDVSFNENLHPDYLTRMFEHRWPRLQKLEISSTNASGSTLSSISNAPQLVSLSARYCSIQGSLPSSISNLKFLHYLNLVKNNFQGPIPDSICEIFPLRHLDLSENKLTGIIPSCIAKLRNLNVLDVSGNSIRGKVSFISFINELDLTTLGLGSNNLTVLIDQQHLHPSKYKLEGLSLESCNMEGFIPTCICNFTYLKYLVLPSNNLTGSIPSCIYKLKNLYSFDVSNNRLEGHIPVLPPVVEYLDLSNNELSGSIPSSICSQKPRMSKTSNIILFNNKLSGTIPTSIGYCSSLTDLYLGNNNLTGNVPNELQKVEGLEILELSDNNLNGTFPKSILKLLSLSFLFLGNNNFEGNIPNSIGSLKSLKILSLRSNRFNGSIPKDIFTLQKLQIIDLAVNNLSGPIPIKLGNLSMLNSRDPSTDFFYRVPYQLVNKGTVAQFDMIRKYNSGIDLSCNILNGNIPEEIRLLQELGMLNLSHNHFSKNIPTSVGNMSSLESLDLSSNRLSGHIPQSLTSLDSLGVLNLSYNNLSGKIPRGSHFDTLSVNGFAFAGNELLCGFPLEKLCNDQYIDVGDTPSSNVDGHSQEDANEKFLLYAIVSMGCAVGFWGLFCVLLVKKQKWWFPYWRFVDSVAVRIVGCIPKKEQ
ncbi:hypothetical protein MKW92_033617 [Papaver armeniacum]|nr:hypothetical protein MKW92_033617 [Papaver armeniacum]